MVIEAVPGVHLQARGMPVRHRLPDAFQFVAPLRYAIGVGIFAGVDLHHRRADFPGRIQLPLIRINEQRYADARIKAALGGALHGIMMPRHIQAALGGQFLPPLRHQADVMRLDAQRVLYHFIGHRAFQVHARLQHAAKYLHVRILNVAAILAQVQGDRIRSRLLANQCRADHIRVTRAAHLAQGGDMVYV